jgi:hypothetical protein
LHIGKIDLNEAETALLAQIDFDARDHDAQLKNAGVIPKLMDSLTSRKAIPDHRERYFVNAEYNTSRHSGSHKDMFERNGTKGREIFEHSSFLKYLKYIALGSDLPNDAILEFSTYVKHHEPIGSDDVSDLLRLSKELANKFSIEPHEASEEFFKLALDCGVHLMWAKHLREWIRKMKLRKRR